MLLVKYFNVFLLLVLCMIFSCGEHHTDPKIWMWNDYQIYGICPVKEFPIKLTPAEELHSTTIEALNIWTSGLSRTYFVIAENGNPVLVATPDHYKYKQHCEPVRLGDGNERGQEFGHTFGWTDFYGSPGNFNVVTYICLEKYNKAIKLMYSGVAERARRIGLVGIVAHEIGHHLLGSGHPKEADLMGETQEFTNLCNDTINLITELFQFC
jgi:hypothetical protein